MSLYYESAPLVLGETAEGKIGVGSLKSRVFGSKTLKSSPTQVYALLTEATKWSFVLKEVIENSQLLIHERKLNPALALLLVHDLLLSKHGIVAPPSHPLRLAVTRHKARLHAELTKARLRRGFSSVESLRKNIDGDDNVHCFMHDESKIGRNPSNITLSQGWLHPRWVRINTLLTNLEEQLRTTFSSFMVVDTLEVLLRNDLEPTGESLLFVDKHIPNLLAISSRSDIQKSSAYSNGLIILQDKASCFPAYLLDPISECGDILDACAAPGNKTTHLAAIVQRQSKSKPKCKVLAYERDRDRATILQNMIKQTGAQEIVTVKLGDFLKTKPQESTWNNVHYVLIDPSCSGSGIIGRDEAPTVALPQSRSDNILKRRSRNRKRAELVAVTSGEFLTHESLHKIGNHDIRLKARLEALSAFQLKLLLHAFKFPQARKITYSTCSLYAQENEHVVIKALQSAVARARRWRILRRDEQVLGAKNWTIRGSLAASQEVLSSGDMCQAQEITEACIRCEKGTVEGTQGFFLAAFVRDEGYDRGQGHEHEHEHNEIKSLISSDTPSNIEVVACHTEDDVAEPEWNGFSEEESEAH